MLGQHRRRWTSINLYTAKLNNLNFHPLELYRDPQLQVGEK